MTAPVTTTRQTPGGIKLKDGYSTKIAFENDPDVEFWEKTVQPPGLDGGDEIPQTTMHNTTVRTFAPRSLYTLTNTTTTVAYDPNSINSIKNNLLNQEGSITVHFPDGSTLDFYGYLKSFTPSDHTEGEQPEAEIVIVATNTDPDNNFTEEVPVLTEVSGT